MMFELPTNAVAELLGVDRVAFYEWVLQGYILPKRPATARGVTAVFDTAGVVAAAIFQRLRHIIRRPAAGKVSRWYQDNSPASGENTVLYVSVEGKAIVDIVGDKQTIECFDGAHYHIIIPLWSIRQWIASRAKEIRSHGPPQKPD